MGGLHVTALDSRTSTPIAKLVNRKRHPASKFVLGGAITFGETEEGTTFRVVYDD
jgi:hypothetical protein